MEAARRGRPRGRVRDRSRRDARRAIRCCSPASCSASSARAPSRSRSIARWSARPRSSSPRRGATCRADDFDALFLAGRSRARHAPVPRQRGRAAADRRVLRDRTSRSPRSVTACSSRRERSAPTARRCSHGVTHDVPAEVHGARRVPRRRSGGAVATTGPIRRTSRTRSAPRSPRRTTSCAARASCPSAARATTTRTRSSSRTAATSRRAGPATRTCSRRS